jgi:hypothetical protein
MFLAPALLLMYGDVERTGWLELNCHLIRSRIL